MPTTSIEEIISQLNNVVVQALTQNQFFQTDATVTICIADANKQCPVPHLNIMMFHAGVPDVSGADTHAVQIWRFNYNPTEQGWTFKLIRPYLAFQKETRQEMTLEQLVEYVGAIITRHNTGTIKVYDERLFNLVRN